MNSKPYVLALGAAVAIFASVYWLLEDKPDTDGLRRATADARAAPAATPALPSAASASASEPAAAPSQASSAAPGDALAAIEAAEKIGDPMQRCIATPTPAAYAWSKETIAAFCADELTPALTWDEFKQAIDDGRAAQLDARLDALIEGYFSGRVPEGALRHAYHDSFRGSSTARKRLIDQWVQAAPASANALAARGMWWASSAEQARGEKRISEIPDADVTRMETALVKAKADLEKALALNPRLMPAYSTLIFAAKFDSDHALAESMLRKSIEIAPDNYYARAAMAFNERPQWGGSFEQMDQIATDAAPYLAKNPRLANLKTIVLAERGMKAYWAKDYAGALRQFDNGLVYGPEWFYLDLARYAASASGNQEHAIELMTQMLRFSPAAIETRRARAGLLSRVGRDAWAQDELDIVLRANPRDTAAMNDYANVLIHRNDYAGAELKLKQLIGADPDNRWANVTLAWLYGKRLQRFAEAAAILDTLQKKEPESGDLWLQRVQLLDNSNGPGMREAIESFLRYADTSVKEQRDAIPIAKQWLASHPK